MAPWARVLILALPLDVTFLRILYNVSTLESYSSSSARLSKWSACLDGLYSNNPPKSVASATASKSILKFYLSLILPANVGNSDSLTHNFTSVSVVVLVVFTERRILTYVYCSRSLSWKSSNNASLVNLVNQCGSLPPLRLQYHLYHICTRRMASWTPYLMSPLPFNWLSVIDPISANHLIF